MKIEFRKIPYTESEFKIVKDSLNCKGTFFKESNRVISLKIYISGSTEHDCDICGDSFDLIVDENIVLKVSDGVSEDEDLDIIECQDHFVDFDEIVQSEINSIKSDYHYCKKCKNENQGE
jgi:hypothetical protein